MTTYSLKKAMKKIALSIVVGIGLLLSLAVAICVTDKLGMGKEPSYSHSLSRIHR